MGFQTRVWRDADSPDGRRPAAFQHAGHYNEVAPVLTGEDRATAEWFFDNLGNYICVYPPALIGLVFLGLRVRHLAR